MSTDPDMSRTTTQHLADELLKEPVEEWIARRRGPTEKPRESWNRIALLLWDRTDRKVGVTGKTIQTWAEAATREDMP